MNTASSPLALPASWRRYVLSRRGGPVGAAATSTRVTVRCSAADLVSDELVGHVLRAEPTPSDIAEAGLAGGGDDGSVLGAAAVAAIRIWLIDHRRWIHPKDVPTLVEAIGTSWLKRHGPVFAAAACATLAGLYVETGSPQHLCRAAPPTGLDGFGRARHLWVATPVRAALATLGDDDYAACVRTLEPYREQSLSQRVAVAFLAPSQTDWHRDDTAAVLQTPPGSPELSKNAAAMASVVTDVDALARLLVHTFDRDLQEDLAPLYTAAATMGTAIGPVLSGLADRVARRGGLGHLHRRLLSMLSVLTGEAVVSAAVAPPASRTHRRNGRTAAGITGAATVTGTATEIEAPRMAWLPGEREEWAAYRQRRPPELRDHMFASLAGRVRLSQLQAHDLAHDQDERTRSGRRLTCFSEVDFFVHGPDGLTRPLLPGWRPEARCAGVKDTWFQVLVARHELLALAPMLALARRRPATVGRALAPYRSAAVAALMATWLGRGAKVHDIARSWFDRHGWPAAALDRHPRRRQASSTDPTGACQPRKPASRTKNPHYSLVYIPRDRTLDDAERALRGAGNVQRLGDELHLVVEDGNARLRVRCRTGPFVGAEAQELARRVGGRLGRHGGRLADARRRFEVAFDAPEAVFDQLDAVVTVHQLLQEVSGGILHTLWNDVVMDPDGNEA